MADTHWLWVLLAVVVLILKKDLQIILRLLDVVASLFPALVRSSWQITCVFTVAGLRQLRE